MNGRAGTATACTLLSLLLSFASASAVDEGAGLYRARCAPCHGNNGEGKSSMKAPSLVGNEVRTMSDKTIRDFIRTRANGEMERDSNHADLKKRLTEDEISRIIAHIHKMQEKYH